MSLHYRMFDLARAERRGQLIQRGKRYNLNLRYYHEIDTWLLSLISHTYVSFRVLAYKGLSLMGTSKYTGFNLNANTNLFHCFGRRFTGPYTGKPVVTLFTVMINSV